MNMSNPTIVIPCFKKIKSLKRLLSSLLKAKYPEDIKIIFSVDYSGEKNVLKILNDFNWPYGDKEIIFYNENIGLRQNIINCGELSIKYGSVIILEDDIYVSKDFYLYALKAKDFYSGDENIAGISLYSYEYSEINSERFYPIYDGKDTFFMQWASSWGQLWTAEQWDCFSKWYEKNKKNDLSTFNIPQNVVDWPESSWKKYYIAYLVDVGKFFVYPYISFVSNCGDAGFHCGEDGFIDKQVCIPMGYDTSLLKFADFSSTLLKYDSFFQIYPEYLKNGNEKIYKYDFDVDIAGTKLKKNFLKEYVLSSKRCQNPVCTFDYVLVPLALNVVNDIEGNYLSLGRTNDFIEEESLFFKAFKSYVNREVPSGRRCLRFLTTRILRKFGFGKRKK